MGTSIGRNIKKIRLAHGLTQDQLGRILGVNKSAVQKYEAGDVQNLKRETIKKLCNHFRAYPDMFIFESGEYWAEHECRNILSSKQLDNIPLEADTDHILTIFRKKFALNEEGFHKVLTYMDDLSQIEKYKRRP